MGCGDLADAPFCRCIARTGREGLVQFSDKVSAQSDDASPLSQCALRDNNGFRLVPSIVPAVPYAKVQAMLIWAEALSVGFACLHSAMWVGAQYGSQAGTPGYLAFREWVVLSFAAPICSIFIDLSWGNLWVMLLILVAIPAISHCLTLPAGSIFLPYTGPKVQLVASSSHHSEPNPPYGPKLLEPPASWVPSAQSNGLTGSRHRSAVRAASNDAREMLALVHVTTVFPLIATGTTAPCLAGGAPTLHASAPDPSRAL